MDYEVIRGTDRVDVVEGADGYVQEGPLTTFFEGQHGASVLGPWSRRLASFRTSDIVSIRASGRPQERPATGSFPVSVWDADERDGRVA